MVELDGRVALVTGAGQGLGRSHALALAGAGAQVVVNDIGEVDGRPTAEVVAEEIIDSGGNAVADTSDITTAEGGAALVATATEAFGGLHVVICNAGIVRDAAFHKMTEEAWTSVRRVHLDGTYHVLQAAWPGLREQAYGRVVVTTSASGLYGSFGQANYGAAKMGLFGLMNTLAIEGKKYGIHVNALSPVAATAMTWDLMTPEMREALDPAYASPVVAYLASEACTQTGIVVHVRGDQYATVKLYQTDPISFGAPPSPQDIADRIEEMLDFEGAIPGAEAWAARS